MTEKQLVQVLRRIQKIRNNLQFYAEDSDKTMGEHHTDTVTLWDAVGALGSAARHLQSILPPHIG